jgi:F-type H+-transporting ATPase subunit b
MELFTPEVGLLIWMLIPFLIVFAILAKFAWPVIIKGVDERAKFIDDSIQSAKEANEKLASIKSEGEAILAAAREEQLKLLKDAADIRDKLIKEAKQQAGVEADKVMQDAKVAIQKEKEDAIRDIRKQVAELSIDIAEKVLRKNLDNKPAQVELVDKLLDEVMISKS